MKRILYVLIAFGVLASCKLEIDDNFDQSAAERARQRMEELQGLLLSSENGWEIAYYPESSQRYGGYTLLGKFETNGRVTLASERGKPDQTIQSHYTINSAMGPVLAFDTYNEFLHYFSDPALNVGAGRGQGFLGDFDFIFMEGDHAQIELKGVKTKNRILLTRFEGSWENYLTSLQKNMDPIKDKDNPLKGWELFINGTSAVKFEVDKDDYNRLGYPDPEIPASTLYVAFRYTDKGIQFYSPVEIGGVTVQDFSINNKLDFVATDNPNITLKHFYDPNYVTYEEYLGEWEFNVATGTGAGSYTVTFTEKEPGKSFTVTGLRYPFTMIYIPRSGEVENKCDEICGTYTTGGNTYDVWKRAASTTGWYNSSAGLAGEIGIVDRSSGQINVKFVSNGAWASWAGFGFYYHYQKPDGTMYNGALVKYLGASMIKK